MRPARAVLVLASLATLLAVPACRSQADGGPVELELLARAPERGNWSPDTLVVPQGQEVTVVIRNVDVVTHGFYLPALGLSVTEIKAGDVRRVTITADSAGTYPFYCSMWCSDYHMQMRGAVVVR